MLFVYLLTLVNLGCLAPSDCQTCHHGVFAISNIRHGPGWHRISDTVDKYRSNRFLKL